MSLVDRLFRRRQVYQSLADEIRSHLDERIDALMAQGMSRADATAAARRAFGNVTNVVEQGRDVWEWPSVESFAMDVRYALRQLRRTPALSATVMLTLAIGIAATTTVFSWARSVLLNPLPGAGDAGRIMALETTTSSGSWTPTSWLDYRDFRRYLKSFDGLAAAYPMSIALGDGRARRASARRARVGELLRRAARPTRARSVVPAQSRRLRRKSADDCHWLRPLENALSRRFVDSRPRGARQRVSVLDHRRRAAVLSWVDARGGGRHLGTGRDARTDRADGRVVARAIAAREHFACLPASPTV